MGMIDSICHPVIVRRVRHGPELRPTEPSFWLQPVIRQTFHACITLPYHRQRYFNFKLVKIRLSIGMT